MSDYERVLASLLGARRRWVVTGGAGFIGSHLVQLLVEHQQEVVVLDNYSTGHRENIEDVRSCVGPGPSNLLTVIEGDIRNSEDCLRAVGGAEIILHQAALGSVPRSVEQPLTTNDVNVGGFLNVLEAARSEGVRRIVYASSSSVYGDHPALPKKEEHVGRPLSPYAASKYCDEIYAHAFGQCYRIELIGLRYFNVFGPRQDANGPYAAVMPRWFAQLLRGERVEIFGDGETTRDFCHIANVVQANVLAATTTEPTALGQAYNVAYGARTSLNELFELIRDEVARFRPDVTSARPLYQPFRPGDVRHSLADTSKAATLLRYRPTRSVREGLAETADYYATIATPAAGR
jgi:UDP-N-acetylglucosamine 4-epimerase